MRVALHGMAGEADRVDEGLVLIEGVLRMPEWVSKMCAKPLRGNPSMFRRYRMNYPEPDATTPSWQEFKNGKG